MQRIKTVRYQARNIGGDRCFTKLRYVIGKRFVPDAISEYHVEMFPFNVGAQATGVTNVHSIHSLFGSTPNLSTLAQFYTRYRIRGIKLTLTAYYVPTPASPPICIFTTAQTSSGHTSAEDPSPPFATPDIVTTPEQRWTRYKVVANTGNGARPTTLSSYYSVNKVYGPDAVVKNDADFIGTLNTAAPYWSDTTNTSSTTFRPARGPWLMYGIFSMDSAGQIPSDTNLTLKVEATVYAEMFSKRPSVE